MRRLWLLLLLVLLPVSVSAQTYTISPPPFLTALDNSGKIINNGCIWTYVAGTTTAATTYTTSTGTANANPIRSDSAGRFTAYLAPGSSYKFVYESSCTPPAHGTVLRTADNISAMPASAASVDITGTAGESITAGQCVYLSAGDGGKNAGQWYKCDNTNAYSSITNWVGIATVNIASAASGTIRISGSVTGLSSLSVGSPYYVGTAGALTATAPANNVRKLGQADSATSLVLKDRDAPTVPFVDDFRLSLTTATCVPTGDVTAATTLYLTPCTGNRITLFDTSGNVETCTTNEISIAVPSTTTQMYDVWAYDSTFGTCTVTLELATTSRTDMTGLQRTNGRWVKSGNSSRLYVGSFRTTGVSGQTEDSVAHRLLFNAYNQKKRDFFKQESTASWTYVTTSTIRQVRATATNQIDLVLGLPDVVVYASYSVVGQQDVAAVQPIKIGIGLDSTTAFAANQTGNMQIINGANQQVDGMAVAVMKPAVGYHTVPMLEAGNGSVTATWYGTGTYTNSATLSGWYEG